MKASEIQLVEVESIQTQLRYLAIKQEQGNKVTLRFLFRERQDLEKYLVFPFFYVIPLTHLEILPYIITAYHAPLEAMKFASGIGVTCELKQKITRPLLWYLDQSLHAFYSKHNLLALYKELSGYREEYHIKVTYPVFSVRNMTDDKYYIDDLKCALCHVFEKYDIRLYRDGVYMSDFTYPNIHSLYNALFYVILYTQRVVAKNNGLII